MVINDLINKKFSKVKEIINFLFVCGLLVYFFFELMNLKSVSCICYFIVINYLLLILIMMFGKNKFFKLMVFVLCALITLFYVARELPFSEEIIKNTFGVAALCYVILVIVSSIYYIFKITKVNIIKEGFYLILLFILSFVLGLLNKNNWEIIAAIVVIINYFFDYKNFFVLFKFIFDIDCFKSVESKLRRDQLIILKFKFDIYLLIIYLFIYFNINIIYNILYYIFEKEIIVFADEIYKGLCIMLQISIIRFFVIKLWRNDKFKIRRWVGQKVYDLILGQSKNYI